MPKAGTRLHSIDPSPPPAATKIPPPPRAMSTMPSGQGPGRSFGHSKQQQKSVPQPPPRPESRFEYVPSFMPRCLSYSRAWIAVSLRSVLQARQGRLLAPRQRVSPRLPAGLGLTIGLLLDMLPHHLLNRRRCLQLDNRMPHQPPGGSDLLRRRR